MLVFKMKMKTKIDYEYLTQRACAWLWNNRETYRIELLTLAQLSAILNVSINTSNIILNKLKMIGAVDQYNFVNYDGVKKFLAIQETSQDQETSKQEKGEQK